MSLKSASLRSKIRYFHPQKINSNSFLMNGSEWLSLPDGGSNEKTSYEV
jgi:hypothetical protein